MKKLAVLSLLAALAATLVVTWHWDQPLAVAGPGFAKPGELGKSGDKSQIRYENALARRQFEYDLLKDPKTGLIPPDARDIELDMASKAPWKQREVGKVDSLVSRGPGNLGGRTRAIAFDHTDLTGSTMLAGGVTSGVFRTTDRGASWTRVSPNDAIHSVTSIVQDRTSPNIWYYSTGEPWNSARLADFLFGDGIWKSTDNGLNWTKLAPTSGAAVEAFDNIFDLVYRLAVDPATGNLYAAVPTFIMRSTDGGASWQPVIQGANSFSVFSSITDIVINGDGTRFFAAINGSAPDNLGGVYTSTTGAAGSWTKVAGTGAAQNPPTWAANGSYGRIVLSTSPSQSNIVYAIYDNNHVNDCEAGTQVKAEADLFRYDAVAGTWTDLTPNLPKDGPCLAGSNPLAVQTGYNLTVAVSPQDPNLVFVGGTVLLRSSLGFTTTLGTSWIGGYANNNTYASFPNHHPDIHTLVFDPTNPDRMICGSDGGIHETIASSPNPTWTSLNNGYVTLQYYHAVQGPLAGDSRVLGGAQDNGTSYSEGGTQHIELIGGDGVSVGIARTVRVGNEDVEVVFAGAQRGRIFRLDTQQNFADIQPPDTDGGIFVTYYLLHPDDSTILFYASADKLYYTNRAYEVSAGTWQQLTGVPTAMAGNNIRSIAVSRGSITHSSKLYIGDDMGRIFRLDDPLGKGRETVPVPITPPGAQAGIVSGLAVDPEDDGVLMAVYANYNIPSIFFTSQADSDQPLWANVSGNLEPTSVRTAAIAQTAAGREFFVGTTVGLWSTTALDGAATSWVREGPTTVASAIVSALDLRTSDNQLLIATHGNGLFAAKLSEPIAASRLTRRYHLPRVWADNGARDTVIGILNPSPRWSAAVEITGFDSAGNIVGVSPLHTSLSRRARARFTLKEAFPASFAQIAWVQIGSDSDLEIFADLVDTGTRSAYRAGFLHETLYLQHIAKDTASFETVISAVNGSHQNLTVNLIGQPGLGQLAIPELTDPFGFSARPITDYFGSNLINGPDLWARLEGDRRGAAAMEVFTSLPDRQLQAALGLDDRSGKLLSFLHVAADTAEFWTGMLYINIGDNQAAVTETYYNAEGAVLIQKNKNVDSGQKVTLFFDFQVQDQVPPGTAWVQVEADQDLIGYELFGTPIISQSKTFAGLQGNHGGGRVLLYPNFTNGADEFTGIVALNLGEESADITFSAYSAAGNLLETTTLFGVGPKTKIVRLATGSGNNLFNQASTQQQGAWIEASANGSQWAGFQLWGDLDPVSRQYVSGINAGIQQVK